MLPLKLLVTFIVYCLTDGTKYSVVALLSFKLYQVMCHRIVYLEISFVYLVLLHIATMF